MTAPGRAHPAALVALVALGGAAGTAGRYALERLVPTPGDWPWPTLLANVLGSFVLGVLLAWLASGRAGAASERLRLGLGTGVLGGFTTYSSLAVGTDRLLADGRAAAALGYLAASLLLGLAAAGAGLALVRPRGPS